MQGVTAFLKRRDHEAAFGEGNALLPGMLLEVAVLTAGAKTVTVTPDPAMGGGGGGGV